MRSTRSDYRHKARIGVRHLPKQNKLLMGFREAQSNHLTEIQTCKILDIELDQALPEIKALLESLKGKSSIGHIELAKGDSEISLLVRHTEKLKAHDVNLLQQYALQKQWQLYLQPAGVESVHRVDHAQADMHLHYRFKRF